MSKQTKRPQLYPPMPISTCREGRTRPKVKIPKNLLRYPPEKHHSSQSLASHYKEKGICRLAAFFWQVTCYFKSKV